MGYIFPKMLLYLIFGEILLTVIQFAEMKTQERKYVFGKTNITVHRI